MENEDNKEEVIEWVDARGFHKRPVDRIGNVDFAQNIAASLFANGVLCFVDTRE